MTWQEISNKAYHKDPALGSTSLKAFAISGAHYKAMIDEEFEETDPMLLGSASHCFIFERDQFDRQYIICEGIRTKKLKEEAAEQGKKVLTVDQGERIVGIDKAIKEIPDPIIKQILQSESFIETSGFWEEQGIKAKCRPDIRIPRLELMIDLKSLDMPFDNKKDLELAFQKRIANLDYHWSADWYMRGAAVIEPGVYNIFAWLVVTSRKPHWAGFFIADDEMLSLAHQEIDELLPQFKECQEKDEWPTPFVGPMKEISLPQWRLGKSIYE